MLVAGAQKVIAFSPRIDGTLLNNFNKFKNYLYIVGNKLVELGAKEA